MAAYHTLQHYWEIGHENNSPQTEAGFNMIMKEMWRWSTEMVQSFKIG